MLKDRLDFNDFSRLVANICRSISIDTWKPDYVVGLTRGGLLPAKMISHYFDIPMKSLEVSLRDHGTKESALYMAEDAVGYVPSEDREKINSTFDPYYRRNILIVDDINDTGETFNWIIDDWMSSCLPNSHVWESVWGKTTRFAVTVDNLASKSRFPMNYVGKEINKQEKDVWIEFPYENWWT